METHLVFLVVFCVSFCSAVPEEAVSYEIKKKVMDTEELKTVYVHAKDMGEWNGDRELLTEKGDLENKEWTH